MKSHLMNPMIMTGMIIVFFALAAYSTALFHEVKTHLASKAVLGFFTAGVLLDITSTTFMIIGSRHIAITPHGLLGYSALAAMLIETVLLWKHKNASGWDSKLSKQLHIYTVAAYSWWVIAFIAGALLVMVK
jgi:hypothetical protein